MEETLPTTCPFCGHDSLTYQGNLAHGQPVMVACTYPQHSPTDFCPRHGQWRPIAYILRLIEKQTRGWPGASRAGRAPVTASSQAREGESP